MFSFVKFIKSFFLPGNLPVFGRECRLLSARPLVVYLSQYAWYENIGHIRSLFERAFYRNALILVFFYWTQEGSHQINRIRKHRLRHLKRFPRHRIVLLANTAKEQEMMRQEGWETAWINHNIFVDPEVFFPIPGSEKRYDAVYDARMTPFKRHELAGDLRSLALITYYRERYHDEDYVRRSRQTLNHAHWFNGSPEEPYRRLSHQEINACLNQCRVGLCLSRVEGAMFASMQYLLAGLPIVSTASIGGRDVFFDPEYTLIVGDSAPEVEAGVREMISRRLSPEKIREKTLLKITGHQNRLFALLEEFVGKRDWTQEWKDWMASTKTSAPPRTVRTFIRHLEKNSL